MPPKGVACDHPEAGSTRAGMCPPSSPGEMPDHVQASAQAHDQFRNAEAFVRQVLELTVENAARDRQSVPARF